MSDNIALDTELASKQSQIISEHTQTSIDKKNAVIQEIDDAINGNGGVAMRGELAKAVSSKIKECFQKNFNDLATRLNNWSTTHADVTKDQINAETEVGDVYRQVM